MPRRANILDVEPTRGWKSDEERGVIGAWFVRAIGDRSIEQVAQDMADRGHAHKPDYYRGIMAGSKKPGRSLLRALEDYLGSTPEPPPATVSADIERLATAIERQAEAMESLVGEIRVGALAVLSSQAGTAGLIGELVDAAQKGTLDELVRALREGGRLPDDADPVGQRE